MISHLMPKLAPAFVLLSCGLLCMTLHAGNTTLGPDWDEESDGGRDAGSTKGDAQKVKLASTSQVATISGKLKGNQGSLAGELPDYEDVYAVVVKNPTTFEIKTTPPTGFAAFDSALFVFDSQGRPLLANRLAEQGANGALVPSVSTNGEFKIDEPGLIYIAIGGRQSFPIDVDNNIVFEFTNDLTDVVGPSLGAPKPFVGWTPGDPGDIGAYTIKLQSVGPIPSYCGAPNAGPCGQVNPFPLCDDASCCFRICELDPFCCEVTWDADCAAQAKSQCTLACKNCEGDLNGDGRIDGMDLSRLLALWGLQDECADIDNDGTVSGADLSTLLLKWGSPCF
jgi:hypothetical protein